VEERRREVTPISAESQQFLESYMAVYAPLASDLDPRRNWPAKRKKLALDVFISNMSLPSSAARSRARRGRRAGARGRKAAPREPTRR
jgi:hypothetical protein